MRRVAYVRHSPIEIARLASIVIGEPTVHRFSSYLDNARDAFTVALRYGARATGTIGGCSLVVTYGRLGRGAPEGQGAIERCLEAQLGPLVQVPSLLEAARWFRERELDYC